MLLCNTEIKKIGDKIDNVEQKMEMYYILQIFLKEKQIKLEAPKLFLDVGIPWSWYRSRVSVATFWKKVQPTITLSLHLLPLLTYKMFFKLTIGEVMQDWGHCICPV